jgi:SAM-dependent methyltransferase
MEAFEYVGTELGLFRDARNWKRYLRAQISPFLHGDVLEVGAGIGGTTAMLHDASYRSWTCLEPDARLSSELSEIVTGLGDARCAAPRVVEGTLHALEIHEEYDSILYIDVLEHIENDRDELGLAARKLRPGGHLIVVSPAHEWLFSAFDRAVGHVRRYTRSDLRERSPEGLELVRLRYLDSVGITASLANRLLMRAEQPNEAQIRVWDRLMIPISRVLDPCLAFSLGKTVLAVWRRDSA